MSYSYSPDELETGTWEDDGGHQEVLCKRCKGTGLDLSMDEDVPCQECDGMGSYLI